MDKHQLEAIALEQGTIMLGQSLIKTKSYTETKINGVSVKRYPKAYAHGFAHIEWSDNFDEVTDLTPNTTRNGELP